MRLREEAMWFVLMLVSLIAVAAAVAIEVAARQGHFQPTGWQTLIWLAAVLFGPIGSVVGIKKTLWADFMANRAITFSLV